MDIEDKELFDSTLTDQVEAPAAVDEPVAQVADANTDGPTRDEHGRFAPKASEPAAQEQMTTEPATTPTAQSEAHVPSWRLREVNEAREAAERRAADLERNYQRQIAELQQRLPKQEPAQRPDMFDNPDGFVEHGVRQAVEPIRGEISKLAEHYSRKDAIREHGKEKVQAAYNAISDALSNQDPEAQAVYQRARAGLDPFGDIVAWHEQKSVYQTIGNDPSKWWDTQLEERMKDPAFRGKVLQQIQQSTQSNGAQPNKIALPPSLNRIGSGASQSEDNDASDGALFAHALR